MLRLGIVYGPSPVEHDGPDSQTVVDKFRRLAAAGERAARSTTAGAATIGAVHVADAARLLLDSPGAEPGGDAPPTSPPRRVTVADVAALAEGREPPGGAAWTRRDAVRVRAPRRGVPGARMKLLVTGATGFLGWRTATLLRRARPRRRRRSPGPAAPAARTPAGIEAERVDAGDPARARRWSPAATRSCTSRASPTRPRARADPARAVRENAGTTAQPARRLPRARRRADLPVDRARRRSSRRPTPTALSKRLGEEACRHHAAPRHRRAADVGVRPRPGRLGGRHRRDRRVRRAARSRAGRS